MAIAVGIVVTEELLASILYTPKTVIAREMVPIYQTLTWALQPFDSLFMKRGWTSTLRWPFQEERPAAGGQGIAGRWVATL
jgi:hypothetical protein